MSKLNNNNNNNNNDKVANYQIKCGINIIYYIVVILFLSGYIITTSIFVPDLFWNILFPLVFAYLFCIYHIYDKSGKKENAIITLVNKEDIEISSSEGTTHSYYFYTDTDRKLKGCARLYYFLQGNETIQVTINRGNTIYGLVKVIDANIDMVRNFAKNDPSMEYTKQGTILLVEDRYLESIVSYDKATDSNPQNALAWNNKGFILSYVFEKYQESICCYDNAIKSYNKDRGQNLEAYILNNKSYALLKLGKLDEFLEYWEKSIKINPKNALAWYNKACYNVQTYEYEEALDDLKYAVSLDNRECLDIVNTYRDFNKVKYDPKFIEFFKENGFQFVG